MPWTQQAVPHCQLTLWCFFARKGVQGPVEWTLNGMHPIPYRNIYITSHGSAGMSIALKDAMRVSLEESEHLVVTVHALRAALGADARCSVISSQRRLSGGPLAQHWARAASSGSSAPPCAHHQATTSGVTFGMPRWCHRHCHAASAAGHGADTSHWHPMERKARLELGLPQ
jgi:hypothetical protein